MNAKQPVTRFEVLGPVRAFSDGHELGLGSRQQRQVLGLLVVRAGSDVPIQQFVEMLWGHAPPTSAMNSLHRFIGSLRRILEPGVAGRSGGTATGRFIHRRDGGYRLLTHDAAVDLAEFRSLAAEAREAERQGRRDTAVDRYLDALRHFRGRCADDGSPGGRFPVFAAVDEEYGTLARDAARAAVTFNRVGALLPAIRRAAELSPLDEALHARLMLMLAAEGRQGDAFGLFHQIRGILSQALGIEPGAELKAAYEEVLRPAKTGPVRPAQIPRDLPQFVGRRNDLERADALLRGGVTMPIIAIDGMPGVGKSTLAIHWAHRIAATFPDGQLYLDLRGHDEGATPMTTRDALYALLSALGVPEDSIPRSDDALAAFYRSNIAGRRVMVLLDNADRAEQVRPLLPGTGGCLVVITSRVSLTALFATYGAQPLTLDLPPAEDARTLLARRLPSPVTIEELDKVVAACGRLPLALTAVATKATLCREQDFLHELRLFDGGLEPDLRSMMDGSFRALSRPAARVLRLLSVHPGPDISAAAAASLAGVPVRAVHPLLAELTRAHLLASRSRRLFLHILVRTYARTLVSKPEADEAFGRLLEHYRHTADAGSAVESDAVEWFRAEQEALHTMIDEAARRDAGPTVWRLANALMPFYRWSGLARDWLTTMTSALHYAERTADQAGQATMHRDVAGAYSYLGDHGQARDHLRRAQRMFAELSLPTEQAHVHVDIGLALLGEPGSGAGNPGAAEAEFRAALALFAQVGQPDGTAVRGLAKCKVATGEHEAAAHLFEQAMATYLRVDDRNGVNDCLLGLGDLARRTGDLPLSLEYLKRAVDIYQAVGNRSDEAFALVSLGDSSAASGAMADAVRAWLAAWKILQDLRLPAAVTVQERLRAAAFDD